MLTLLTTCTDSNKALSLIAKTEQQLSLRDNLSAPLLVQSGEKKHIIPQIMRLIEFYLKVTGRTMEEFNILVLAGDLYDAFRTDTLEDISLMLKMARTGEMGKIYRGDYVEIMSWVPLYLSKKAEAREERYKEEKARYLAPERDATPTQMPEEIRKIYEERRKAMQEKSPPILTPKGVELMAKWSRKNSM